MPPSLPCHNVAKTHTSASRCVRTTPSRQGVIGSDQSSGARGGRARHGKSLSSSRIKLQHPSESQLLVFRGKERGHRGTNGRGWDTIAQVGTLFFIAHPVWRYRSMHETNLDMFRFPWRSNHKPPVSRYTSGGSPACLTDRWSYIDVEFILSQSSFRDGNLHTWGLGLAHRLLECTMGHGRPKLRHTYVAGRTSICPPP